MTQKSHFYKGSYRLVVQPYTKACTCPVCKKLFGYDVDLDSFLLHGACSDCVDTYYYPNADLWDKGWRPNLEGEKNDI